MAINGNLPNQTNNSADTRTYFNNFYDLPQTTSPMINDAVVAFFQKITGNADTGKNLAAAVIYTALQQGIDPMSIVDQLKALNDKNRLNSPETYYSHETNDQAQDDYVFDSQTGTWTTGTKQYAKPGPSTAYAYVTELDAYLIMLLNLNRVGTSLLGISNSPRTSPYVERMILA
jgi:hypothetical protein